MSLLERILLNASTLVVTATGLVYLWMKYAMTGHDPFSAYHHPWQPHALALHLLAGPFLVFALGLIAREHIVGRLLEDRPHRSRPSGIAAMLLAAPMIVSGYLIQIVTHSGARRVLVVAHVASGLLFALLFVGHLVLARPERRAANDGRGREGRPPSPGGHRLDRSEPCDIESIARSERAATRAGPGGRRP